MTWFATIVIPAFVVGPRRHDGLARSTDPLGPVDQDPDVPRDVACELTATGSVCSPATVPPRPPSNGGGGGGVSGPGLGFGPILVVILVLLLVAAVAWLATVVVRGRSSDSEDDEVEDLDEDLDGEVTDTRIIDVERPPDRWRRAAQEHREAGRFRDAVRCQYRGVVGDLARAGIVDEIPGRTSGEERDQLRELAPDVSPAFDSAADIFDEAWFNDLVVTSDHDERFRAAERIVLDHVLAGRGSGRSRLRGRNSDASAVQQ